MVEKTEWYFKIFQLFGNNSNIISNIQIQLVRIKNATQEMREKVITPMKFLQKIANADNKIMRCTSEEFINQNENENEHNQSNLSTIEISDSDSNDESDEDIGKCLICFENFIEVLLMSCGHLCVCKGCWQSCQDSRTKGRPTCPKTDCTMIVKKFRFVSI